MRGRRVARSPRHTPWPTFQCRALTITLMGSEPLRFYRRGAYTTGIMKLKSVLTLFDLRKAGEIERDRILREAAIAADKHDVSATGRLIGKAATFAPVPTDVVIDLMRRTFGIAGCGAKKRRAA